MLFYSKKNTSVSNKMLKLDFSLFKHYKIIDTFRIKAVTSDKIKI